VWSLLAETTGFNEAMPALTSGGALAIVAWFARYLISTTIPLMQTDHRQQIKDLVENHNKAMTEQAQRMLDQSVALSSAMKELVTELRAARDGYDRWKRWVMKIPETGAET
jgi:threonine dehydrogenase-like Zn-dependent dehydrogenase